MAIASAKAIPSNIGTKSLSTLSGLRPMDSIALDPILPIASAGAMPPTAIASALANNSAVSGVIIVLLLDWIYCLESALMVIIRAWLWPKNLAADNLYTVGVGSMCSLASSPCESLWWETSAVATVRYTRASMEKTVA